MLRRLWFLISAVWAAIILAAGTTRLTGIQEMDWTMAAAPFVLGIALRLAARFVLGRSAPGTLKQ